MQVPTVKIQHPDDPSQAMLINESDFDPGVHKAWDEAPKADVSDVRSILDVGVRKLPDHLSDIEDVGLIARAMEADERATAVPIYEARLAELSEPPPAA